MSTFLILVFGIGLVALGLAVWAALPAGPSEADPAPQSSAASEPAERRARQPKPAVVHILEALGTPAMIPGPYRFQDYAYELTTVLTNKAPAAPYRAPMNICAWVTEGTR